MNISRNILVNLTISGSRGALKGATGSWWMLLKTGWLVYSPRRRLGMSEYQAGVRTSITCCTFSRAALSFHNFSWSPQLATTTLGGGATKLTVL